MKTKRQAKILEFIRTYEIDTQDELLRRLSEDGFDVTQATVSRDMKELRIIKTLSKEGRYRYSAGQDDPREAPAKFYTLLADSALSVAPAGNLIAVKCLVGMAQAVCVAMDSLPWDGVVGTLAGDDTIFILCRDEACASLLAQELNRYLPER